MNSWQYAQSILACRGAKDAAQCVVTRAVIGGRVITHSDDRYDTLILQTGEAASVAEFPVVRRFLSMLGDSKGQ